LTQKPIGYWTAEKEGVKHNEYSFKCIN
jgi:hypothetical protein